MSALTQATARRKPNIRPGTGGTEKESVELLTGDIGYEHTNDIEKEKNKIDEEKELVFASCGAGRNFLALHRTTPGAGARK